MQITVLKACHYVVFRVSVQCDGTHPSMLVRFPDEGAQRGGLVAGRKSIDCGCRRKNSFYRYDMPRRENCDRKLVLDRTDTKASNLEDYSNKTARLGSACAMC
jgi:hypothetical protein